MNRILIMGAPGVGKGTQAVTIAAHFGIPAISSGDIFRDQVDRRTPLGEAARGYMDAGDYVPDELTNAMICDRLAQSDCWRGFLLDGYPRTLAQVATLDELLGETGVAIDAVVELVVDPEELVQRLLRRARIELRADDTEAVIRRRQEVYAEETAPLLAEYESRGVLFRVDGTGSVNKVAARIFEALGIRV
jgi:adenylate kinase